MSETYLRLFKERAEMIEKALDIYAISKNNYQKNIYEAMRYCLLGGGKRLRGVLCLCGGLLAGGQAEDVIPFACGVEMIHAYSLVHDDLPAMDNDDMRRGKPSCHKQFDEATAILTGDALLNGAFELILDRSRMSSENTLAAMKIIADSSGADGMIGGQVVDLACENKEITYEQLLYLHRHKTGALISAALLSGYTACGGNPENLPVLKEYSSKIGLAFQVIDDILDVTGSETALGKKPGSDMENGKSTFISFMGLKGSKDFAKRLTDEAKEIVKPLGEEGAFLSWLAGYLLERNF